MNRALYYNHIEERLMTLCSIIKLRGKLNILDYHLHSENFYRDFFNKLYNWNLKNLNSEIHNVEAIDLIDQLNHIIVQVSSTNTSTKINNSLSKPILLGSEYNGFNFKFIFIVEDANELRNKKYITPKGIQFNPKDDIYDCKTILADIQSLDINALKIIFDLIRSELGQVTTESKLESNLAAIINVLSKENLSIIAKTNTLNSFEIERKIEFNDLKTSQYIIEDYKVYHHIVDRIYSEFDKIGINKSLSVLNKIRTEYINLSNSLSGDELFSQIISNLSSIIRNSANFEYVEIEELEMCVGILTVDAFIRCKIFRNPNDYSYVAAR